QPALEIAERVAPRLFAHTRSVTRPGGCKLQSGASAAANRRVTLRFSCCYPAEIGLDSDPSSASRCSAGRHRWLTLEVDDVRGAGGTEVADVDALGSADADPADQRVVHMPEERVPRLGAADHLEQRG